MWARVSTYELAGQDLEEAIRGFERAVAQLRAMEGASDAYLLVDRGSGRALTVTLWESEEALAASEDAADRLRREASGDRVQSVDRYEVAFHQSFR